MADHRFVCAHCGQLTTETGHFRRETPERPACPHTHVTVPVQHRHLDQWIGGPERRPRGFGYCCPLDHHCRWSSVSRRTTRRDGSWRSEPPTLRQLQYLTALGYTGEQPQTKGVAHDLLSAILAPDDEHTEPPPIRAMRLRNST